ncbi:MAG TPA: hypothetical protein VLT15_02915 [Acidimicrobiia bacterium]|nr:hypothetical protein [Acidimicrobiia bacterium]
MNPFTAETALALHHAKEREIQKRIRLAANLPRSSRRRLATRGSSPARQLRPAF